MEQGAASPCLHPLQGCNPTLKWEIGTGMGLCHPSSLDFAAFSPCLSNSECSHIIPVLNQLLNGF